MIDPRSRLADDSATSPSAATGPILVIEDDLPIRRAVKRTVSSMTTRVQEAETGAEGLRLLASTRPALVILDLALPDMEGADVCREIRKASQVPIIVLSARRSEDDIIALLELGADDYVTKPFSLRELGARVGAQLRRVNRNFALADSAIVTAGDMQLDLNSNRVTRDGGVLQLTPLECRLLRALVINAGRTLTHRELFDEVWDRAHGSPQHYLRVLLTKLRQKIEPDRSSPTLIITEPGVGYRFEMPDDDAGKISTRVTSSSSARGGEATDTADKP